MNVVPNNMKLRKIVDDDHPWLIELHNDPQVLRNLTDPRPITLFSHVAWWLNTQNNPRQRRYIFTVNDERVGLAKISDLDVVNSNCLLGGDIHVLHRGKGYAKHMWSLLLDVVFLEHGLNRAGLTTAEYNVLGQRVYRGLGFKEEGRLIKHLYRDGAFHDQICMYMLRSDWVNQDE